MRKFTTANPVNVLFFLFHRYQSLHGSSALLQWKRRDEFKLPRSELVDRICRILILRRSNGVPDLSFNFSDDLVDAVLRKLRLNANACLEFFELASKQQHFRPHINSYCKIVHILSRGRMFDETRLYLNELVGLCKNKNAGFMIWDELVRIYREFSFSPTVFDMILKVYAKKGLTKHALYAFDNMGKCGCLPSLQSCNSLLSSLVKNGERYIAFCVYDQMIRLGIVPDIYTYTIMVDAYCKDGRVIKAMEFVKEMKDLGFEPSAVTYHCLINGHVELGIYKVLKRCWS
ncbi:hypothetical protein NMG60_11020755 [Bertholletia excelsa]